MKKTLIIAALSLFAATAYCQTPTTAAPPPDKPKPVFQVPLVKDVPMDIVLHLKAYQVNDYIFVEQNGIQAIFSSDKITAARASGFQINHQAVIDSINKAVLSQWTSFYKTEEKAWQDTLGKGAPAVIAKKGGKKT